MYHGDDGQLRSFFSGLSAVAGVASGGGFGSGQLDQLVFGYCDRYFASGNAATRTSGGVGKLVEELLGSERGRTWRVVDGVERVGRRGGSSVRCHGDGVGSVGNQGTVGEVGGAVDSVDVRGLGLEDSGRSESVVSGVTGVEGVAKKKKMGKNQRDRAKYEKFGGNWREPAGVAGSLPVVRSKARDSLERKWEVENRVAIAKAELAEEKAKKDLEFQRARDVEAEIKRSRTLVMKQTESNKVATEKAFATLRATGNVPGFCETVVSGGGSVPGLSGGSSAEDCMISPDSSASMHEFREAQKKILDLEDKIRKMERAERMRATVGEVAITNDGDEPTPSLQEEMDRQDEKYNTQYVYEPAFVGGKNVLLLKCETFGDYCEGGDY